MVYIVYVCGYVCDCVVVLLLLHVTDDIVAYSCTIACVVIGICMYACVHI